MTTTTPTSGAADLRAEVAMIDAAMVEMTNITPPLKRSECARLLRAALAAGQATAAKQAPECPSMPETWHVVAHVLGEPILSIGYDWLSGKGELTEAETQAVIGMAQHMLAFVGYGLPPSSFDPDADEATAAQAVVPAGWKLVPTEPTHNMLAAMAECDGWLPGDRDRPGLTRWEDYWRMAIAAAPPQPAAQQGAAYAAPPSHEHQLAIMEGERNASLDAYSRVVYLTSAESRLYERAFTSGWDRRDRLASYGQAPAQAAPAAVETDPCPGCIPGGYCRTPKCGRLIAMNAAKNAAPAAVAGANDPSITLDLKMASKLLDMFGGEPGLVTLQHGGEKCHSGAGLYAWYSDLPEEGAVFLGAEPDDEAAPTTQPAPQHAAQQGDENDGDWRRLALQFDNHRMQALWHLKALLKDGDHAKAATEFLAAPPLSGEEVLAQRIAALARIDAEPAPQQEPILYDLKALLEVFQTARAGASSTAGTLRGIAAVIASWESRPDPHTWLIAAPQPSPAAQGDALDAARYRWLRERSSTMFVNISINGEGAEIAATLDSAVDAARAAQEGK